MAGLFGTLSHAKKHRMDSTIDHKPVAGAIPDHVAVFDANLLPVKDSGVSIHALTGAMVYQGVWDASTNTPTLLDTDTDVTGHVYRCNVGGTVDFGSGPIFFNAGDAVANNGTIWEKWDAADLITSVEGRTGDILLKDADIYMDGKETRISTITRVHLLNTPPGTPESDVVYLVGASPTGAWVGKAGNFTVWRSGAWEFFLPRKGFLAITYYGAADPQVHRCTAVGTGIATWLLLDFVIKHSLLSERLWSRASHTIDTDIWMDGYETRISTVTRVHRHSIPPATPDPDVVYLLIAPDGGGWPANRNGYFAVWRNSAWVFFQPRRGFFAMEVGPGATLILWRCHYVSTDLCEWERIETNLLHSLLSQKNWANAGHVMDTNLPMAGFKVTGMADPTLDQDAATKIYVDSTASSATDKKSSQYWVSTDFGDDTNGDGGINKPFKTVQKAIDTALSVGLAEIFIDYTVGLTVIESVNVPADMIVTIFGTSWDLNYPSIAVGLSINLVNASTSKCVLNNVLADDITGANNAEVNTEGCYIKKTTGTGSKMITCLGTYIEDTAGFKLLSGYYRDLGTGNWVFSNDIWIGNQVPGNKLLQDKYQMPDVTLAGVTPTDADLSAASWGAGFRGMGIGTTGRIFLMYNTGTAGAPVVKYVELS